MQVTDAGPGAATLPLQSALQPCSTSWQNTSYCPLNRPGTLLCMFFIVASVLPGCDRASQRVATSQLCHACRHARSRRMHRALLGWRRMFDCLEATASCITKVVTATAPWIASKAARCHSELAPSPQPPSHLHALPMHSSDADCLSGGHTTWLPCGIDAFLTTIGI